MSIYLPLHPRRECLCQCLCPFNISTSTFQCTSDHYTAHNRGTNPQSPSPLLQVQVQEHVLVCLRATNIRNRFAEEIYHVRFFVVCALVAVGISQREVA